MKIYTKTGDKGKTSLFGGKRVSKAHPRIESYGTIDELNVHTGLLRDHLTDPRVCNILLEIQDRLFTIGSCLAADPDKPHLIKPDLIPDDILTLEREIDDMNKSLPEMHAFVLPGGHPSVCYCHLARVVCRRAERLVITLHEQEKIDDLIIQYLNRLSDYFFVLSRLVGQRLNAKEILWRSRK